MPAATTVRVFELVTTPSNERGTPNELSSIEVPGDGDEAKAAARKKLIDSGWSVRSLNWGPDPSKAVAPPMLIAYVHRQAGG